MDSKLPKTSQTTDNQQVEQFLTLFMDAQKSIYTYILTLIPSRSDADDIMQETLMVMWRKFSEFEQDREFVAWGVGIAKFQIMSYRKKQARKPYQFSDETFEALADMKIDSKLTDRRLTVLQDCLKKLSQRDYQVMKMLYEKKVSTQHIAEAINRSIHTVYKMVPKIHGLLHDCIRNNMKVESR